MLLKGTKLTKKFLALVTALTVMFTMAGFVLPASAEDGTVKGGDAITTSGAYSLEAGATGTITIADGLDVTIDGHSYDAESGSFTTKYTDLNLVVGDQTKLTLKDVYVDVAEDAKSIIDFTGKGTLYISGHNLLDRPDGYGSSSTIHVGPAADVTFDGDGYLWGYKHAAGSFIGSDANEVCGNVTFNGGTWMMKASKTGALIGQDSTEEATGKVTINGGTIYLKAVARGSLLGASAQGKAPDVEVNGGQLEFVTDWQGAAIGSSNAANAGNLTVNGGSIRTIVTQNAYSPWGIDPETHKGAVLTDNNITAAHDTAMLAFDASDYAAAESINVYLDDETTTPFYSGGLYEFCTNEVKNPTTPYTNSTMCNWLPNTAQYKLTAESEYVSAYPVVDGSQLAGDNTLVFQLSKEDHFLNVNGDEYQAKWDSENNAFTLSAVTSEEIATYVDPDGKSYSIKDTDISRYGEEKTLTMNGKERTAVFAKLADLAAAKGAALPQCSFEAVAGDTSQYYDASEELYVYIDGGSLRMAVDNGPGWKWWSGVSSIIAKNHAYENGFCTNLIGNGKGTAGPSYALDPEAETYTVTEAAQLAAVAAAVNGGNDLAGKTVVLGDDINLDAYAANWDAEAEIPAYTGGWTAIGNASNAFAGTFDGAGKTISNMTIPAGTGGYRGLFGNNSGTVKNFTITGQYGSEEHPLNVAGDCFAGAVAYNTGTVEGIVANVPMVLTGGDGYATAGVVGRNAGGTVSKCGNEADISCDTTKSFYRNGGVVGHLNGGTISECYNHGRIEGWNYRNGNQGTGGIVGSIDAGTVEYCYNTGTVHNGKGDSATGGKQGTGGIAGAIAAGDVTHSYATANTYGPASTGVVIGKVGNGSYDHLFSLDSARGYQQYGTQTDAETGFKYCDGADENEDGSFKFGGAAIANSYNAGYTITNSFTKSDTDLKSLAFVDELNDGSTAFQVSCNSYPVLSWEEATAHTPGKAVVENEIDATYEKDATYDEVVYCSVCQAEISRETKAVEDTALKTVAEKAAEAAEAAAAEAAEKTGEEAVEAAEAAVEAAQAAKEAAEAALDAAAAEVAAGTLDEAALTEAQEAYDDAVVALNDANEVLAEDVKEAVETADLRDEAVVYLAQLTDLVDRSVYTNGSCDAYDEAYEAFNELVVGEKASSATTKDIRAARSAVTKAYASLVVRTSIAPAVVSGLKDVNYSGKAITQKPVVTLDGTVLAATDYKVAFKNNKNAGTATVTVTGGGDDYTGTATAAFKIKKIANTVTAKAAKKTVKVKKVKKKAQTVAKAVAVSKAQGAVTYKKAGGNAKLSINAKTGKITVKKGTKKGTYKITVKVTAKGNVNYNAKTVTVKNVTVVVK